MGVDNVIEAIQEACAVVLRSHSLTISELVTMVSAGAGVPAATVEAALRQEDKFSIDVEGKVVLQNERKRKSPSPSPVLSPAANKKVCEIEGRVHEPNGDFTTAVSSNHDVLRQSKYNEANKGKAMMEDMKGENKMQFKKLALTNIIPTGTNRDKVAQQAAVRRYLSLSPPQFAEQVASLGDFAKIAIQSLVLCEVSDASSFTKTAIPVVGIRCRHCMGHNDLSTASLLFPKSLRMIFRIALLLLRKHLMQSCPHVPTSVQWGLEDAIRNRGPGGICGPGDDLQAYLALIIDHYRLKGLGGDRGVCCEHSSIPEEEEAAKVSKMGNLLEPSQSPNHDVDIPVEHNVVSEVEINDPHARSKAPPKSCYVSKQESDSSGLLEFDSLVAASISTYHDESERLGVRCRHCRTRFNLDPCKSNGFASDRNGFPATLSKMVKHHLVNYCNEIPLPDQSALKEERKRLRRQRNSQKQLDRLIRIMLGCAEETPIESQHQQQQTRKKKEGNNDQKRISVEISRPQTREYVTTSTAPTATPVTPIANHNLRRKEAELQLLETEATPQESHSKRPRLELVEQRDSVPARPGYVHYSLAPKSLACLTSSLSEAMQITVQAAVFCEVLDVTSFAQHNAGGVQGIIGIQCRYCVQQCCATECPISFPQSPATLLPTILTLAHNHLSVSCQHIPWPVQQQLKTALRARRETHTVDGFLSSYLVALTDFYQLIGQDGENGITRMKGNGTKDMLIATKQRNTQRSSPQPNTGTKEVIDLSQPPEPDTDVEDDDLSTAEYKWYSLTPKQFSRERKTLSPYDRRLIHSIVLIVDGGALGIRCRHCSEAMKFPGRSPSLLRCSMYIMANQHLTGSCKKISDADRSILRTRTRIPESSGGFLHLAQYIQLVLRLHSIDVHHDDCEHVDGIRKFSPDYCYASVEYQPNYGPTDDAVTRVHTPIAIDRPTTHASKQQYYPTEEVSSSTIS